MNSKVLYVDFAKNKKHNKNNYSIFKLVVIRIKRFFHITINEDASKIINYDNKDIM